MYVLYEVTASVFIHFKLTGNSSLFKGFYLKKQISLSQDK